MAASTRRSRGRVVAPAALKRQISAFLSGVVPRLHSASPRTGRLRAALVPSRSPYPAPIGNFRHFRPPEDARVEASPGSGAVPLCGRRLAACARRGGPAPPSAAHAPWSWRAGSLAEREEPRRATGPHCPDCRCRPARRDPPSQTPTPFGSARAPHAQLGRGDGRMSGGRRKEEPPQPQLANGALKVSVWSKVLRSDAAWDDKVRKAGRGRTGPGLPRPSRPGGRGSRERGGKGAGA